MVFVYVNHPNARDAADLARSLVETRLAAAVNILPQVGTVYRWNAAVETGSDTVLIIKTAASLIESVTAHVRRHHPYECPCIATIDVLAAPAAYLAWVADNTATAAPPG